MEDLRQSLHRTLDAAQAHDVRESLDVARSLRFCRFEMTFNKRISYPQRIRVKFLFKRISEENRLINQLVLKIGTPPAACRNHDTEQWIFKYNTKSDLKLKLTFIC